MMIVCRFGRPHGRFRRAEVPAKPHHVQRRTVGRAGEGVRQESLSVRVNERATSGKNFLVGGESPGGPLALFFRINIRNF